MHMDKHMMTEKMSSFQNNMFVFVVDTTEHTHTYQHYSNLHMIFDSHRVIAVSRAPLSVAAHHSGWHADPSCPSLPAESDP